MEQTKKGLDLLQLLRKFLRRIVIVPALLPQMLIPPVGGRARGLLSFFLRPVCVALSVLYPSCCVPLGVAPIVVLDIPSTGKSSNSSSSSSTWGFCCC